MFYITPGCSRLQEKQPATFFAHTQLLTQDFLHVDLTAAWHLHYQHCTYATQRI